ncbi:GNAT family N-acetyltransferase [Lutibacter sp. A80]|uniref:GNAT family N-acetyltransferase n=1 Tax=Lutibacter sp. A80 TaxID=2918453 RepID=UPI001F056FD0|nr:GNAT family N-acetyltransferase [Lutibacter sp. A80]UMB61337.1 GNAT family N-acetyltransferase [Lutibacter sp. A80]
MLFETERLVIRTLKISDSEPFFDMMGNPNVMNPIPQKVMSKTESDITLKKLIALEKNSTKKIWSLIEKESSNFIGICGLLKNNEDEPEIAYRLREKYWGKGYGTEIAKGLINFSFETLNFNIITADVNIINMKSVKILEKFFIKDHDFFNKRDNCTDRRYKLTKTNWAKTFKNN